MALWGRKSSVLQRWLSCWVPWKTSVLSCVAWLLKVWPGWSRSWETPASLSRPLCCALTGAAMITYLSGIVEPFQCCRQL